jgi:hypothetical protein
VSTPEMAARLEEVTSPISQLDASLSPFLAHLMAGLSDQIKVMTCEAAATAVAKEKDRILNEFRLILQGEATKTLERVMLTSKEELASRTLKELNETFEAAVQQKHERWIKTIEQDVGRVTADIQQNMDSSRREIVERVRSQAAPVVGEAQAALQKLQTLKDEMKVNLVTMCKQFEEFLQESADKSATHMQAKIAEAGKQFENNVNARVTAADAAVTESNSRALLKLSQDCQQTAENQLKLLAATAEQTTNAVKDSAESSRQSLGEMEALVLSRIESIGESLVNIAKRSKSDPH